MGQKFIMDYENYTLSIESCHLPALGECEKCPFLNKCNSGEKCLIPKSRHKHRDRREYYLQKKQERELAMGV